MVARPNATVRRWPGLGLVDGIAMGERRRVVVVEDAVDMRLLPRAALALTTTSQVGRSQPIGHCQATSYRSALCRIEYRRDRIAASLETSASSTAEAFADAR